ncbi:MAG: diacylglycerol kinase family protein [Candidatus Endonucleobacter bathymodioli]|uniref:Diacylglycerol kinase family protein n=1 Tax=Candidatus Endonucleibacter bathymodioli TaxID=539814 RepID=A0AA90NZT4_9GAMM|nr:diacylglycerol kinase family protein [Candidatus Endonucleobacter bathymodioli]
MLYSIRLNCSICKSLTLFFIMLCAANLYASKEIIFIVNPTSGGGTCGEIWDGMENEIKKQVEENGSVFKVFKTGVEVETLVFSGELKRQEKFHHRLTDAGKLLERLMDKKYIKLNNDNMTTIVSVGGDGTFNQIASTLFKKEQLDKRHNLSKQDEIHYTLAILPFGTGNSLAQGLNIPIEKTDAARKSAVDIAINDQTTLAGCFEVTHQKGICFSFVELDFGASCKAGKLQKVPPAILRPLFGCVSGQTQYDIAAVLTVLRPPKTKVTVTLHQNMDIKNKESEHQDDEQPPTNNADGMLKNLIFEMKKLTFGAATVSPYFGGNFKIHPDAQTQGDVAYISFINHMNMFGKMLHLKDLKNGNHTKDSHTYSKTIALKENEILEITPYKDSEIPFQIDGEINAGLLPITIEWLPKSYNIKTSVARKVSCALDQLPLNDGATTEGAIKSW